MTALIAASILLIAASAATLAFGWLTATASLVWVSIACSVSSAVTLALAYNRSRAAAVAPPVADPPDRVLLRPSGGRTTEEISLFDPDSGMGDA